MDWKDVKPDDIIDVGKKKLGDFWPFLPWIILGLFVLVGLKGREGI